MVQHFVKQMQSELEMSLVGELTYFRGLQVKQMEDSIFLCQSKYVKNIVKKFGLENTSHKRTTTPTHLKLSKDEKDISVDQSLYRSMIGSLLYLTTSRPDITFAIGVCVRYQPELKAGSVDDRKSTCGGCFFLGNNLVSWFNKKQNCVSLSTAEAEYIAAVLPKMLKQSSPKHMHVSTENIESSSPTARADEPF
ncbi:uncharacterized mitochondrial protein AtMg00810-like [Lathyrus oleraceus]|uniref:uncharacterized mitochondrial protein AtMg00810-like n=1 Tax=Pisum sativum TaxID=3888 RepID=UPI0021CE3524|nr:uncharacterized mitochondrial protein AtMg00810-like [Pisum sativum]